MEINVDEHSLFYWIKAIHSFITESFHLNVQLFPLALAYMVELNEGELGFNIYELGIEHGHEEFKVAHLTRL